MLGVAWTFSSSESFQGCTEQRKSENKYSKLYSQDGLVNLLPLLVKLNTGCIEYVFWDDHTAFEAGSAIAGILFSAVLTFWNILLWRETRNAARAGARQADIAERALLDLEAPSVFLDVDQEFSEVTVTDKLGGMVGINSISTKKIPGQWYFCFVNYGRTPAFLISVNAAVVPAIKGQIPEKICESDNTMPRGAVIPPGDKSKKFIMTVPHIEGESVVFLSVCCRFSDIFNNEYLAGFSYVMLNNTGFRLTHYKDGYNYLIRVKAGTKKSNS